VAAAGTVYHLTLEEIKRCIREAGYIPRQRNVFYELIDTEPTHMPLPPTTNGMHSLPVIV
jgi:cyclic dehypoxanthinyl futalosine synthase